MSDFPEQFIVTITERVPTEPKYRDTNTYHVICDGLLKVAEVIDQYALNWPVVVSITITPWTE